MSSKNALWSDLLGFVQRLRFVYKVLRHTGMDSKKITEFFSNSCVLHHLHTTQDLIIYAFQPTADREAAWWQSWSIYYGREIGKIKEFRPRNRRRKEQTEKEGELVLFPVR